MEGEAAQLNNLRKFLKKEQYGKALEICDKILEQNPADIDLYKVKILCCIHLQKFDNALEIADFNGEFAFEKAYCLYRKNQVHLLRSLPLTSCFKLNEALSVCNSVKSKSDDILNLMAQTLHKLQRYEDAADVYERLLDSQSSIDIDTDLYTNYYSACVSAGRGGLALSGHHLNDTEVGSSFDLMYNIACAQISSGDYYAARSSLSSAARICHDVLSSEGMTDEEIKAESTAIRLQTSFVDILTGRETDASLEQCKDVLKSIKKDNELLAVAANNLAVLRGATDLPDSLRRLRNTISTASEEKLTRSQLMEIRYNRCVLLLHMKKIDECLRTLDELDKMYGVTSRSVMIRSAINSLSGDYLNCAKSLEEDIKKLSGSSDITLLSALLAQLYINQGSYAEAESQISALNQLKYSPAGISAIYQLKILQDPNGSTAMKYLLSAAESLTNSAEDVSDSTRTAALFQISQELEKHQFYQESANVLQSLLTRCAESIDSSERLMASAKLAIALSYVKPAEAQKSARSLPKLDANSVDARALEVGEIPRLQKRKGIEKLPPNPSTIDATAKREKSKALQKERILRRRSKLRELYLRRLQELGKYDPNRPTKPDPERWIPLKHRSYSKRGKKNRNKFVGGQGSGDGAHKDMQRLDAYARSHGADGTQKKQVGVVIEAPAITSSKKNRKKR